MPHIVTFFSVIWHKQRNSETKKTTKTTRTKFFPLALFIRDGILFSKQEELPKGEGVSDFWNLDKQGGHEKIAQK